MLGILLAGLVGFVLSALLFVVLRRVLGG